jgi:Spx/MgsR family transcriptional regulator
MLQLYLKPNCSTCRKARALLREKGAEFEEVDLNRGLSEAEIERLIGERDYRQFLNTRNELYRERGMGRNVPPRDEAVRLMAAHPNLIKRPILVSGERMVLGCDVAGIEGLIGGERRS